MKYINLAWSAIWGFLSAMIFVTGILIITTLSFGPVYSDTNYMIIKIAFIISSILWIGCVIYLIKDIISKKRKAFFEKSSSLLLYCSLSIFAGLIIGVVCMLILRQFT